MRPLNILELRDTDEIGGPGKTILETARAIDRSRFTVHLGVFQRRNEHADTPFTTAAKQLAIPVHQIRAFNQFDPRLAVRTADLIRRLGIDIVHAHEVKSDVIAYLASLLRRVAIVTTLHGWIGNSQRQKAFIQLDKRIVRAFQLVIAVSRPILRDALDAGVPESRVRLLNNAIVLDRYRRFEGGALARLIGREPRGPVLTSIGRLSAEKGHADLLEALGLLALDGKRLETVIVGDGPERAALEARAQRLGLEDWVHFVGYLDRPQSVLNEAHLLALPSHTEGLPNVALEALAMDVPVLATNVGGTPEVVIHDRTGRLVPRRDPVAMARELVDFLNNPSAWARLASEGRQHVEDHFDFTQRTRALEGMYDQLVPGALR